MFNGSLIEDLFAAVKKAEHSAQLLLPQATGARDPGAEPQAVSTDRAGGGSEAE